MRHTIRQLIVLGGALIAPLQGFAQQHDTRLLRDYRYVATQDPWLTATNAAALTRYAPASIAEARLSAGTTAGGFTNYDEAARQLSAGGSVEAFQRLSPRTVVYGRLHYDNTTARDMAGSAFIDTGRLPFNIVEDSLTNTGEQHRDTYWLTGAIGTLVTDRLSAGLRFDYTAANLAKYKDLRHKNKLMDMTLTAGFYLPAGAFSIGAAAHYRRHTESVRFGTYGTADKVYKSLIDYAVFTGRVEQFGNSGYTDQSREMPLLDNCYGATLQIGWQLTPRIAFYNALNTQWRSGFYGSKSPFTITYTDHDARLYSYQASITARTATQLHRLDLSLQAENLENRQNVFQELTNESGAHHYEYYDPVKTANKRWVDVHAAYTAHLGLRHELPAWTLCLAYDHRHRRQTVYAYPYRRRQTIDRTEGSISLTRNIVMHHGVLTAGASFAYAKGSGSPYDDDPFVAPDDKQAPPAEMTYYLMQEHHYLTAAQYLLGAQLRYTFSLPATGIVPFAEVQATHRKANEPSDYSGGRDHTALQLTVGCCF